MKGYQSALPRRLTAQNCALVMSEPQVWLSWDLARNGTWRRGEYMTADWSPTGFFENLDSSDRHHLPLLSCSSIPNLVRWSQSDWLPLVWQKPARKQGLSCFHCQGQALAYARASAWKQVLVAYAWQL